jgi:hypothetical protein
MTFRRSTSLGVVLLSALANATDAETSREEARTFAVALTNKLDLILRDDESMLQALSKEYSQEVAHRILLETSRDQASEALIEWTTQRTHYQDKLSEKGLSALDREKLEVFVAAAKKEVGKARAAKEKAENDLKPVETSVTKKSLTLEDWKKRASRHKSELVPMSAEATLLASKLSVAEGPEVPSDDPALVFKRLEEIAVAASSTSIVSVTATVGGKRESGLRVRYQRKIDYEEKRGAPENVPVLTDADDPTKCVSNGIIFGRYYFWLEDKGTQRSRPLVITIQEDSVPIELVPE